MIPTSKYCRKSNPKEPIIFGLSFRRAAVCLTFASAGLWCAMPQQAQANPYTLIEENFEETIVGARVKPGDKSTKNTGMAPSIGGKIVSWISDEAEIVKGWDGKALQIRDTEVNGSLRLLFKTEGVDPISTGKLEVSLDFQIDGESVSPFKGTLLSVALNTPGRSGFCRVDLLAPEMDLLVTDGQHDLPHKALRPEKNLTLSLNTVYTLKLLLSLDESTYSLQIQNKKTGDVVAEFSGLQFMIPASEGLAENALDIRGSMNRSEEGMTGSLNPVTIDNILVTHIP